MNLDEASVILAQYGVRPYFVEDLGKIKRVTADKGVFALKVVPPAQGTEFIRHVQTLYQKGYYRVVPIYPTLDGRYAVLHQSALYYLMPWLPNEEKEDTSQKNKKLFRELARLHTLSSKEYPIKKEDRKEHYENTLLLLEKDEEFLVGFLEQCEKKIYMSPFELQFCLYYHDVHQALRFSKKQLEAWYEKTKEEEKIRTVLIHGKFSSDHFLFDNKGYGYFMNFENARQGSPYQDILPYLFRSLKGFPMRSEDCIDWLLIYYKYFPLKEEEKQLMLSYFTHPTAFLRVVKKYYKQPTAVRKKERKFSQQLQRQYWQLKNTEYVVSRLNEIERQRKAQAEAQAQAQQEGAQN
ncbi:spore coat protein YsxE [Bacillus sp. T3]|uniref:spore coat protein YsxE n=1 Tax=Bacillus sp. T3 TaxID=467262 RepID=UPI002982A2F4|nr:spore coat protein YsxE [Bacillus sp. T3]